MSSELPSLGRALVIFGLALAACGTLLAIGPKLPWLGRLPGDISLQRDGFSFYFPLTTCILISVLVSLIAWAVGKFRG